MDTHYFKTTFDTPFGLYEVVVLEQTAEYAKQQARYTIAGDMNVHLATVQPKGEVVQCNGHVKRNMWAIRGASFDGKQWAWCKKIK